ncbi:hypothetical protein FHG87_012658 [Trinorchestia longiramus]|nr:hypothetical protein FHG87_012658 [Trinorchestia longiramus]
MQLLTQLQQLGRERQQLRTVCSQTEQQLQHLDKTKALLAHRRSSLIRDLANVYPIVQISPREDFSICDVWVPEATQYNESNLSTPSFQVSFNRSKSSRSISSAKTSSVNSKENKNSRESSPLLLNSDSKEKAEKINPSQSTTSTFYSGSSRSSDNQKSTSKKSIEGSYSTTRSAQVYPPFHPNQNVNQSPVALPHTMESLSAGLGMSAHLLCLLSGLLQMPLRYPISPDGSLATITDVASTMLMENCRKKDDPLTKCLPDMRCQPLLNINNPGLLSDILSPFLPSVPHTSLSVPKSSSGISLGQCQESKISSTSRSPSHSRSNSQSLSQSPQRIVSKSLSPSLSHRGINVVIEPSGLFSDINSSDAKGSRALAHSASVGNLVNVSCTSQELSPSSRFQTLKPTVDNDSENFRTFGMTTPNSLDSRVCISSQITLSLDKGLDHIKSVVDEVRERGMLPEDITDSAGIDFSKGSAESKLATSTCSLTNLTRNKTLMVVSNSIDFEEPGASNCEDETTQLLKSWHEDNPSQFSYTSGGSTDLLEEVGVEATETFMQSSSTLKPEEISSNSQYNVPLVGFRKSGEPEIEKIYNSTPQEPETYLDSKSGKRPTNRNEEKRKNSKSKTRSFWPFSRSNTSEESSKDNNSVSEPLLAGDEDEEFECLKVDDPKASQDSWMNSALANSRKDVDLLDISVEENTPLLARENKASDELLKQSLAAMSKEITVNANLDELSDLSQVANRTAKLASKPFTFKLSGK